MRDLAVLDLRPYLLVQEMQVGHVFIPAAPGGHLGGHAGDGVLGAAPHAAVHHDAVVHVVPQDVDGVLGLDPLLHSDPDTTQLNAFT